MIIADVDEESGHHGPGLPTPPNLYYPAFAMPEQPDCGEGDGGRCPECKSGGDKFRANGGSGISTRKKLLFLLLVASLSLLR